MNRKTLATLSVLIVVLLAGCAGLTTYSAPPAETDEDLASEYNYNITEQDELNFSESISVADFSQDISVTSWFTLYEKDISNELVSDEDYKSPIIFATINTPSINISDQEYNPLLQSSDEYIKQFISEEIDNVEIHDQVDTINTTHNEMDQDINISKYDATFKIDELGVSFDGYVLMSTVELNDGVAILMGGYPETYSEEEDNIIDLMSHTQSVENIE